MLNPIFQSSSSSFGTSRARQRRDRVELLSKDVADELNTYKNFGVFYSFNNVFAPKYDPNTYEDDAVDNAQDKSSPNKPGTPAVRSLFNKFSAVLTGAGPEQNGWGSKTMSQAVQDLVHQASPFRLTNNTPLLDTPQNRRTLREMSGCSVRELVKASHAGYFGVGTYSYADFMYCKNLGRVSNNYLITLRRFPIPVLDSITPMGRGKMRKAAGKADIQFPIGTMVTWMGVSGNDMKNILKYNYKMSFVENTAQWEQVQTEGGQGGILNGLEAAFNPATRSQYATGTENPALSGLMGSFFAGQAAGPYSYKDAHDATYTKNKIHGPIDRVKSAYSRGEEGLSFDQKISVVFEYELKAYNGINPRQAMLDLLASIISVTYTTGGFWKGGYYGGGQRQSSAFANLNIFKCKGTFSDFMDALATDLDKGVSAAKQNLGLTSDPKTWVNAAAKILNNIGGMLMGGILNKLGRPKKYFAPSLISDAPVGLWHLTIGNPHHPIMSLGNLVLLNTEVEHSGPLGLDDFPTNLKVTCELVRGKPRDQYFIEQMYMSGNDRIYHTMAGKVSDMYRVAKQYKSDPNVMPNDIIQTQSATTDSEMTDQVSSGGKIQSNKSAGETNSLINAQMSASMSSRDVADYINYYFGGKDSTVLIWSAEEQDHGSSKRVVPGEQAMAEKNDANKGASDSPNANTNT